MGKLRHSLSMCLADQYLQNLDQSFDLLSVFPVGQDMFAKASSFSGSLHRHCRLKEEFKKTATLHRHLTKQLLVSNLKLNPVAQNPKTITGNSQMLLSGTSALVSLRCHSRSTLTVGRLSNIYQNGITGRQQNKTHIKQLKHHHILQWINQ